MTFAPISACHHPRDWELASQLLDDYLDWLGCASGVGDVGTVQPSADVERLDLRAAFAGPDDRFFLARLGALAAGTVGARRLDHDDVELVRLFVHPAARGSGLGRRLTERVLLHAIEVGARRIVLDTHDRVMPEAAAMYRSLGFEETDEPCPIPVPGAVRYALPLTLSLRYASL
ncbi:MAG: GNAT family N-acetyltransferase [Actinomycetota bacterium]